MRIEKGNPSALSKRRRVARVPIPSGEAPAKDTPRVPHFSRLLREVGGRELSHIRAPPSPTIITRGNQLFAIFDRPDPAQQEIHTPVVTSNLALAQKSLHHGRSTDGKRSPTETIPKSCV
jgi:hypothetical protein